MYLKETYVKELECLMSKSEPTEAPFSHRKLCSQNASSVVLPLIWGLPDITLPHRVMLLHYLSLVFSVYSCWHWRTLGIHEGWVQQWSLRGNQYLI